MEASVNIKEYAKFNNKIHTKNVNISNTKQAIKSNSQSGVREVR